MRLNLSGKVHLTTLHDFQFFIEYLQYMAIIAKATVGALIHCTELQDGLEHYKFTKC